MDYSLLEIIPELMTGSVRNIHDTYNESFGLSGMAKEAKPQIEPKIRIDGKVVKRFIAGDIPDGQEVSFIKDTDFTTEFVTAPLYGKGWHIPIAQMIRNMDYLNNFRSARIDGSRLSSLNAMIENGAIECVSMIKRAENKQVIDILDTGTVQLDNYTNINFGRDANNSKIISTATLKWTIANAATMHPFQDLDTGAEQIADRGNSSGADIYAIIGRDSYKAYVNSNDYKAESDQRRNYRVERLDGISALKNVNIPVGSVYRETIRKGSVGMIHIFTYNQTFTNTSENPEQYIAGNKVYMIADDNVIERQPVNIQTFDVYAKNSMMRNAMKKMPQMKGWLTTPEWGRTNERNLAWGVYKKFLTLMQTPNKTYSLQTND